MVLIIVYTLRLNHIYLYNGKEGTMRTRKMKQGFTLVEIMILVSIITLLAVITIPNLRHFRMTANDRLAQATLRRISTAAETYKTANNGNYPENESTLTGATPPYLDMAYCTSSPIAGYTYNCSGMSTSGYTITATPVSVGNTGSATQTITTGGILTP